MIKRRDFIKTLSAGSLACFLPVRFFLNGEETDAGIQLYTVRELMKNDPDGTLMKISEIGYRYIEAAAYSKRKLYNMKPKDFAKKLRSLKLKLISSHVTLNDDNIVEAIDSHAEAGCKYIVLPYLPESKRQGIDDYKKLADRLNRFGEKTAASGIKLGYHNHDFEFDIMDGQKGFDVLLEETEPGLVCFELDIFWIIYAGYQPEPYFDKHPGRFDLWHVKDMNNLEEKKFTEVGNGIIDFEKIFKSAKRSGMEYYFVEQDHCENPPMESIEMSYNNLQKMKLYNE